MDRTRQIAATGITSGPFVYDDVTLDGGEEEAHLANGQKEGEGTQKRVLIMCDPAFVKYLRKIKIINYEKYIFNNIKILII